jgi:putative tributyrin esterase
MIQNVRSELVYSGALNGRRNCFVYLPPGYEGSERRYPVIYLLHGRSGSEADWIFKVKAHETINDLIAKKQLRECIAVMPSDGGHDRGTFYLDWYDGSGNFEEYIINDLIPHIDKHYRTVNSREGRAAAGYSMGGFGSFLLSLRNPELFGAAASMSGVLAPVASHEQWETARMVGPMHGPYAKQRDLAILTQMRSAEDVRPALYFNCGKGDFLFEANLWMKQHLESLGYPFEYDIFEGEHSFDYFLEHLPDLLRFMEKYFHRKKLP